MSSIFAKDVMIRDVYTIGPDEKIAHARLMMIRHNIGALPVVTEDNSLVGILTLRDIYFAGGMSVMTLSVKDIMTKKNLITGTETTTLLDLADIMSETGIQRIPIVDSEMKLLGLVTQSVLIRSFRVLFEQPPT